MKRLKHFFCCSYKEYYQSFVKNKKRKSVKQSEIITYQPKLLKIQKLLI